MLELDWAFFAIAAPAALFAGISKGGFGSGAAFASSSILAVFFDPGVALGIMLPLLMLIDVASLRSYWKKWSWPDARLMILGALPGIAVGAWLYQQTNPDVLRLMIGIICLAFVAWQMVQRSGAIGQVPRRLPKGVGALAGLTAGFTSFVSHAGGPPVAVYLLSRGLDKTRYQATTVLVFWVINISKFIPYLMLGLFTTTTASANLALAPFALIGAWIGIVAHRHIPERLFFGVTYVLLAITGCKLIWDALV